MDEGWNAIQFCIVLFRILSSGLCQKTAMAERSSSFSLAWKRNLKPDTMVAPTICYPLEQIILFLKDVFPLEGTMCLLLMWKEVDSWSFQTHTHTHMYTHSLSNITSPWKAKIATIILCFSYFWDIWHDLGSILSYPSLHSLCSLVLPDAFGEILAASTTSKRWGAW